MKCLLTNQICGSIHLTSFSVIFADFSCQCEQIEFLVRISVQSCLLFVEAIESVSRSYQKSLKRTSVSYYVNFTFNLPRLSGHRPDN